MRRRFVPLILAIASLAPACGGDDGTGMSLSISRSVSALAADVVRARVQVHVEGRSCNAVKSSGADKRATHAAELNVQGGGMGEAQINQIRPGRYTIAVWTFGADMVAREFGCKEQVEIVEGERTDVPITVDPI